MKKHRDAYVTGVGVISKLGNTIEDYWNELNKDDTSEKQTICVNNINTKISADIVSAKKYERNFIEYFLEICCEAINHAIKDAGIILTEQNGCIIVGTGMGIADAFISLQDQPPDFMSQLETKIQNRIKANIKVITIANACCAGAQAIAYAYDLLNTGEYNFVIAGGVEAFSYITYCGFKRLNSIDDTGCKPFDKNRKGIHVGDGAVFFVLKSQKSNPSYCKLLGQAVTIDAYHVVSPEPGGIQISRAIRQALARANAATSEIDAVIAHGTGTKLNDFIEAKVLYEIFEKINVIAPKGKIGHTGGASGAFGLLTAICTLKYQCFPHIVNLNEFDESMEINPVMFRSKNQIVKNLIVNCFAFGGTNTVLVCGL